MIRACQFMPVVLLLLSCSGRRIEEDRVSLIFSDSEDTISQALSALENGAAFADVAREYSSGPNSEAGGDIGYIELSDLQPILLEELRNLETGQYSGIVEGANGFFILIKGDERITTVPFDWPRILTIAALAVVAILLLLFIARSVVYHADAERSSIRLPDGAFLTVFSAVDSSVQAAKQDTNRIKRLVVFQYCISLIFITFKRPSVGYLIEDGESTLPMATPYIFISLLLGWWGFPWGPIYTVSTVITNLRGGKEVIEGGVIGSH